MISDSAATQTFDPTQARYLSSYVARRAYADAIQYPPRVSGVKDTIDIHCHAHEGQQDALALAKHASASGMRGILYKSIVGRQRPAESVRKVHDDLSRWCDDNKIEPIHAWAGYNVAPGVTPPSADATRKQLEDGVSAVWMPVAMHANTLSKVGGRPVWWDKSADPHQNTEPIPWEEALKIGHYLLDERGQLKQEIKDIFAIIADKNAAVFFAHATHPEIFAMAEEVDKLGIKKAVVDHPFSPFVNLEVEQMQQLARGGVFLNFTYDELSPLLGVDPARMCKAIRAIGVQQVTLSSDAGEPLFPNSVEAMRQICAYMRAFGLSDEEVRQVSVVNPGKITGLNA